MSFFKVFEKRFSLFVAFVALVCVAFLAPRTAQAHPWISCPANATPTMSDMGVRVSSSQQYHVYCTGQDTPHQGVLAEAHGMTADQIEANNNGRFLYRCPNSHDAQGHIRQFRNGTFPLVNGTLDAHFDEISSQYQGCYRTTVDHTALWVPFVAQQTPGERLDQIRTEDLSAALALPAAPERAPRLRQVYSEGVRLFQQTPRPSDLQVTQFFTAFEPLIISSTTIPSQAVPATAEHSIDQPPPPVLEPPRVAPIVTNAVNVPSSNIGLYLIGGLSLAALLGFGWFKRRRLKVLLEKRLYLIGGLSLAALLGFGWLMRRWLTASLNAHPHLIIGFLVVLLAGLLGVWWLDRSRLRRLLSKERDANLKIRLACRAVYPWLEVTPEKIEGLLVQGRDHTDLLRKFDELVPAVERPLTVDRIQSLLESEAAMPKVRRELADQVAKTESEASKYAEERLRATKLESELTALRGTDQVAKATRLEAEATKLESEFAALRVTFKQQGDALKEIQDERESSDAEYDALKRNYDILLKLRIEEKEWTKELLESWEVTSQQFLGSLKFCIRLAFSDMDTGSGRFSYTTLNGLQEELRDGVTDAITVLSRSHAAFSVYVNSFKDFCERHELDLPTPEFIADELNPPPRSLEDLFVKDKFDIIRYLDTHAPTRSDGVIDYRNGNGHPASAGTNGHSVGAALKIGAHSSRVPTIAPPPPPSAVDNEATRPSIRLPPSDDGDGTAE